MAWFGLGKPSVGGDAVLVVVGLSLLLVLAHPLSGLQSFRRASIGLTLWFWAAAVLFIIPYAWTVDELNRSGPLGQLLSASAFFALLSHGSSRYADEPLFHRLTKALLLFGLGICGGTLIAGQVQFAIVFLAAVGLLYTFERFVFALRPSVGGIVFAFAIPLAMLIGLRLGHLLAIPLIASFLIGFACLLTEEEAKSR